MRLPTWVNVVLVLTLLASCSAANTAGDAVNRLVGGSSGESLSADEVGDLCRLLGAVAAKEGIDLDEALPGDATSQCATVAREAAGP